MAKYVLSIDAGGIRAIIPALILSEIEKRTNKPISAIFDLITGTSTGGMVAAALCTPKKNGAPYSASEVTEILQAYGPYIFETKSLRKSMSMILRPKNPSKNMECVLEKYFQQGTLADAPTNLMLATFDIKSNSPFFLKSWKEDRNGLTMRNSVRATTSTITHFAPAVLEVGQTTRILLDGAIFAYNPSMCAYASSKNLFPNNKIQILSLGTGKIKIQSVENSNDLGKIGWIDPIIDIFFAAGVEAIDYQMCKLIGDSYMRIQSKIPIAIAGMNNISQENFARLRDIADSWIQKHEDILNKFCSSSKCE